MARSFMRILGATAGVALVSLIQARRAERERASFSAAPVSSGVRARSLLTGIAGVGLIALARGGAGIPLRLLGGRLLASALRPRRMP